MSHQIQVTIVQHDIFAVQIVPIKIHLLFQSVLGAN